MLAAGGRFSMTVGEDLNLKVGVQVLSEQETLALAKSLRKQDDEKQKRKQDEKRISKVIKAVKERVVYECLESGN